MADRVRGDADIGIAVLGKYRITAVRIAGATRVLATPKRPIRGLIAPIAAQHGRRFIRHERTSGPTLTFNEIGHKPTFTSLFLSDMLPTG